MAAGKLNGGKSKATVFFLQYFYKSTKLIESETARDLSLKEKLIFWSYYFSSVKILQTAIEFIRQENSERDEMSFITIHFGGKHSSSLALKSLGLSS